jgi:hypothetical protein
MLHRAGTNGVLELREIRGPRGASWPGRAHRVHLQGGLVAAVETALPVPPLGEILRRDRLASDQAVRALMDAIEEGDRRVAGEILRAGGLASEGAIRAALRSQLRERVNALFRIEEASIGFHTARPAPHVVRVTLSAAEFLHGRPRARDRGQGRADHAAQHEETPPPRSGVRPVVVDDARTRARRLLGLPEGAGLVEVRRAFRKLASALHPDRVGPGTEQRFAELSAAYHLLVA